MVCLIGAIEVEGKIFKNDFMQTIEVFRKIAKNNKINTEAIREYAFEAIVLLIENLPKLSLKQKDLFRNVYQTIFSYMIFCACEPDTVWLNPPAGTITPSLNTYISKDSYLVMKMMKNTPLDTLWTYSTVLPEA